MKRLCACGRLVEKGERCVCRIERQRDRQKRADAQRPSARARGYDADWQALRAAQLKAFPSCKFCGRPAKHVDHVIEVRKAPQRRLDPTNLRSLCHSCHSRRTARDHWGKG